MITVADSGAGKIVSFAAGVNRDVVPTRSLTACGRPVGRRGSQWTSGDLLVVSLLGAQEDFAPGASAARLLTPRSAGRSWDSPSRTGRDRLPLLGSYLEAEPGHGWHGVRAAQAAGGGTDTCHWSVASGTLPRPYSLMRARMQSQARHRGRNEHGHAQVDQLEPAGGAERHASFTSRVVAGGGGSVFDAKGVRARSATPF